MCIGYQLNIILLIYIFINTLKKGLYFNILKFIFIIFIYIYLEKELYKL